MLFPLKVYLHSIVCGRCLGFVLIDAVGRIEQFCDQKLHKLEIVQSTTDISYAWAAFKSSSQCDEHEYSSHRN